MNITHNKKLQHMLAAEYVLGTLRGGARRRFDTWLKNDPHLQQVLREWQGHLMPMMEFSSAKTPQIQVWKNIEQQLRLSTQQVHTSLFDFINRINFWRNLSLLASTALILLAVFVFKPQDTASTNELFVATLSDDQAQAVAIISSDIKNRQVLLRFINRPQLANNQSLELWSISKEAKVRSLGLVSETLGDELLRIKLPPGINHETPQLFAISLEPKGGSGNPEKPSGPILFKGSWLKVG